jgi:hypothetical protein
MFTNNQFPYLSGFKITRHIFTDASFVGWGTEFNGQSTGGNWSLSELETANINFLELQTVYLGLGCFLEELYDKHVKICSDNSTAVAYINNFGGTKYMS